MKIPAFSIQCYRESLCRSLHGFYTAAHVTLALLLRDYGSLNSWKKLRNWKIRPRCPIVC